MKFVKERATLICGSLKKAMVVQRIPVLNWKMKEGCFLTPQDADATKYDTSAAANNKIDLEAEGLSVSDWLNGHMVNVDHSDADWKDYDASTMQFYEMDKHYWFTTELVVPQEMDGKSMWLNIRTQIEHWSDGQNPQFILFINGEVIQGLDINHREVNISKYAKAGEKLRLDLQTYTGTLFREFKLLVDLEERSELIKNLYYDIQIPLWSLDRMNENERVKWQMENIITDTINLIDLRKIYSPQFYASVQKAHEYIQANLYENPEMSGFDDVIATCIGHTHIDVAWLWTVAQVRQKSCRSFATVLKLMEEYPSYKFMSSQPQLYEFIKQRDPQQYAKIKQRVAEGRWETEGGMWVEADCNITSGESLARQFMFGKRFFKEEFGKENVILWLPDVFGYSGALPQIMKKSGIKYFMTTKLAWNQFNKVPTDTFWWEGIDGTRIFTHLITTLGVGQPESSFFTTYNGMLHPDALMGGWHRYQNKEFNNDILISYGFGDGGGGPTREMMETSIRMEKGLKGMPKVRQEVSRVYFDELYEKVKDAKRLPTWVGELYFEYHRGTYTSMARNKRENRKNEYRLMEVELMSVLAELAAKEGLEYPTQQLNDMWKLMLRNQFHDILPGSSVKDVYDVTQQEYKQIHKEGEELIDARIHAITPQGEGLTVFNTLGYDRDDIVNLGNVDAPAVSDGTNVYPTQKTADGTLAYIKNIPSKGYKGLSLCNAKEEKSAFVITADGIDTPYYTIKIDEVGQFTSIVDKEADRELLPKGQVGNELRVYEDKPMCYDNWDIDIYYTEKSWPILDDAVCEWVENGPVRATLKVSKKVMDTVVEQKIHFYAQDRRIDFETYVDWKMSQHLCKVHFPLDIHSDEAAFDIQFGNIKRKIHQNTSWDMARFESCAHKWADFSETGYGVSLLNDCKYGYSLLDKKLSLTLIKSGIDPNPVTDQEEHYFTYSLYPHMGTWKPETTVREAFNLNVPTRVTVGGTAGMDYSFANCDQANVVLETIKKAEDGNGIVVRLYEIENTRTNVTLTFDRPVAFVEEVNLIEESVEDGEVVISSENAVKFQIKPYEIKSYRVVF